MLGEVATDASGRVARGDQVHSIQDAASPRVLLAQGHVGLSGTHKIGHLVGTGGQVDEVLGTPFADGLFLGKVLGSILKNGCRMAK